MRRSCEADSLRGALEATTPADFIREAKPNETGRASKASQPARRPGEGSRPMTMKKTPYSAALR
jgi:hypothetical protein